MRFIIVGLILIVIISCATVLTSTDRPITVIQRFSVSGFPEMSLDDTFGFFLNDDTGRFFTDSHESYYWHSRDSRYALIFQADEKNKVKTVIAVYYDKSQSNCAQEVRKWLIAAKAPDLPSVTSLLDENAPTYEATWTPNGHLIHVKAWVAENTANFKEWEGVLHLYPKEVVIISGGPTIHSSGRVLAPSLRSAAAARR